MTEALTESFCERCGTRYEFKAPTRLSPLRKTRGLIGGLKNYLTSQDALSDAVGDAIRSEEDQLAAAQLDAFHESFNFCIDCRQYTCVSCWNEGAGRCRSCAPLVGVDDLAARLEPALGTIGSGVGLNAQATQPIGLEAWPTTDLPVGGGTADVADWPTTDALAEAEAEPILALETSEVAETVEVEAEPEPVVAVEPEPEPVVAVEPEPEPVEIAEPEPVVATEPEPEPVVAGEPEPVVAVEPEPEPVVIEAEPEPVVAVEPEPVVEPEPEPVLAMEPEPEPEAELPVAIEVAPEPVSPLRVVAWDEDAPIELEPLPEPEQVLAPEPEPIAEPAAASAAEEAPEPAPHPIMPISETILHLPRRGGPRPIEMDAEEIPSEPAAAALTATEREAAELAAAAAANAPDVAARRAQLDSLGLDDPGQGRVGPAAPNVLPYRSRGAAAAQPGATFWEASAREVTATGEIAVQNCGGCGLSLSANARFCRRCGTRQAQSA